MPAKRNDKRIGRLDEENLNRLLSYMRESGLKQSKVAELLGVSKATLSHITSGRRNIFGDQLKALNSLLKTSK